MSISVEHISKTFKNKRKPEEPAQVLKRYFFFEVGEGEFVSLFWSLRMWKDNNVDNYCPDSKSRMMEKLL